jgi:hypothetical protein
MTEREPPDRTSLANALAAEEARLRQLEVERDDAKAQVEVFRAQLAKLDEPPIARSQIRGGCATVPQTASEKAELFRQLFRGRDDL